MSASIHRSRRISRAIPFVLGSLLIGSVRCTSQVHLGPRPYTEEVLADSPLLYLRLDDRAGTTAKDSVGAHDGTYPANGITLGEEGALLADTNGAVSTDGSTFITMPAGLDFAQASAFSIEIWVKPTKYDATTGYGFVVDHQSYGPRNGYVLRVSSTDLGVERWDHDSTHGSNATQNSPVALGGWHHVVATFDGTSLALYLDGARVAYNGVESHLEPMTDTWALGGQNCECSGNSYAGALDEFALYDKPLTAERIRTHFLASGR